MMAVVPFSHVSLMTFVPAWSSDLIISICPFLFIAAMRAVFPCIFLALMSAPELINSWTISI